MVLEPKQPDEKPQQRVHVVSAKRNPNRRFHLPRWFWTRFVPVVCLVPGVLLVGHWLGMDPIPLRIIVFLGCLVVAFAPLVSRRPRHVAGVFAAGVLMGLVLLGIVLLVVLGLCAAYLAGS